MTLSNSVLGELSLVAAIQRIAPSLSASSLALLSLAYRESLTAYRQLAAYSYLLMGIPIFVLITSLIKSLIAL
jgi:hypothetical protein